MTEPMTSPAGYDEFQAAGANLSEQQLWSVAMRAPVMLWLANPEGESVFYNETWQAFIGEDAKGSPGDTWYRALHPEDKQRVLDTFSEFFRRHHRFEMQYRLRRADGQYRLVLDTGEPYYSPDGDYLGFVGSTMDITDRITSEEELRRSHAEMKRHSLEMNLIEQLNTHLQVCRTVEETHPVISHFIKKLFPDDSGAVFLYNDTKTLVELVVSWGKELNSEQVFGHDDCWSLRKGKVHLVNDPHDSITCQHLHHTPSQGFTCTPMIAHGEIVGMLHLQFAKSEFNSEDESDTESDRELVLRHRRVMTAADNLALALSSLKLREALRLQSVRDPLTQLFNRRYMEETFEREISRACRSESELSVIMIDIDHFKSYNDKHGHDAGDQILREVGFFLNRSVRAEDVACRYGGEEFILIMPGANEQIAMQRAEMLREGIKTIGIQYQGARLMDIRISAGVSVYPLHGNTVESIVKAADSALYQAKAGGRDLVKLAVNPEQENVVGDPAAAAANAAA